MFGIRLLLLLEISCARDASLAVCARHLRCYPIHCIAWILFAFNFRERACRDCTCV